MMHSSRRMSVITLVMAFGAGALFSDSPLQPACVATAPVPKPGPISLVPSAAQASGLLRQDTVGTEAAQRPALQTARLVLSPVPVSDPFNGRIAYDENVTVRINSPIAGRVTRLRVEAGDEVRRDAVLLELSSPDLATAQADWHRGQADEVRKKLAFERARALLDNEVIARKDFEAADADYAQARAETRRAAQRLKNLNAGAAENGSFGLKTPMAGVVAERQVTPGMEVRPDQAAPLFVITDPSRLWVMIDVPERSIAAIHPGQAVSIETDAFPDQRFAARVERVGFALDPATRRIQVRCSVANAQRKLRPEMFARVAFLADTGRQAFAVPNASLIVEGIHEFAFVEKSAGVYEKRQVKVAQRGRERSYVESGLASGEMLVTAGALLLNAELAAHAR
ncbi:MAG: efflux RND transporter periplasmic adaptor subunit [Janthinobacterium lividum]